MASIEFNKLSDFEKLAHANWYTKEQKKKIELLNNRIEILFLDKSVYGLFFNDVNFICL